MNKPPADVTYQEILREWDRIDCNTDDKARIDALAAELDKRQIDF